MDRLISEQAVIDVINGCLINRQTVIDKIKAIPSAEPSGDCIRRADVLDLIEDMTDQFGVRHRVITEGVIELLPSVKPQYTDDEIQKMQDLEQAEIQKAYELGQEDRPTGHWEWLTEDKYRCSSCNHETRVDECMNKPMYDFCPFCGAKMVEPQERSDKK